ncbi:MAG TPA: 2-phosphosulfolactate phosphatase, partial [Coleofasciculaceae cyanobacterium]
VNYLLSHRPETVWLAGSGWEGSFSLEDTVCAGAIVQLLSSHPAVGHSLAEIAGNDEVFGAVALYAQWQDKLFELFCHASHGQRLLRLDCLDDLKYCAQTDVLDVLPMQREPGVMVKG